MFGNIDPITHHGKNFQITLRENVGISENSPQKNNQQGLSPSVHAFAVALSDKIALTENHDEKISFVVTKQYLDLKTIMERISNIERIRVSGKSVIIHNVLSNEQPSTSIIDKDFNQYYENNFAQPLYKLYFNTVPTVYLIEHNINTVSAISNSIQNESVILIHDMTDPKNPIILVLLVPLSGFLLIRSEEEKFQFFKLKQTLSFCFVVILISSIVVTPLSISPSFLSAVYAQEMNGSNTNNAIQSNKSQTLNTITNSTHTTVPTNSTHTVPTNSAKPSLSDQFSITDKIALNYTNTYKIPNATKSWQFNSIQNVTTVGSTKIQNNTNLTSLKLVGAGYLTQQINSTRNLSALTLSAWIKPDYSHGSPQFTIISKENQFVLSINNIISPIKIATFSVFDGIKWSTVNSTVPIQENWTHLAAIFNGSSISIYVNGTLQSTMHITGIPTLSVNGQLTTKTVDKISSNADIVIGAYLNTVRGNPSNQFSGLIKNVNLYDTVLSQSQIDQLSNNIPSSHKSMNSISNPTLSDQIGFADTVTIRSSLLNTTSVIPTNATIPINVTITPELKTVKKNYLITETPQLEFHYLNDSDILKKAQKKIKDQLTKIDKVEQNLNKAEAVINSTSNELSSTTIKQINQTQHQIDAVQEQIKKTQQTIDAAEKSKSLQQMQEALNQTIATQKQIQEISTIFKSTGDQIKQTDQQVNTIKNLTSSAQDIARAGAELSNTQQTQSGKWTDSNETITVKVTGPNGKIINTQQQIQQVVDGKFTIEISSTRDITPGVYKVETTLVKDGKTYTANDSYQWGLVSLNTKKSIYKSGEIADFIIVVLDNGGHSVCNANIEMNIADPNGNTKILSSGNGITPNSQCGLYDAQYTTTSEGNYTINLSAQNPSGIAKFNTSFLVQNSFAFDVIRTADSKIDPTKSNSFNVRIDISSYVNQKTLQIQEFVPSVFNVITNANVQVIGDTKILTWNKDLIGNKTFVEYSYSVPLKFPELYALGSAQINYGSNQTFREARNWFVAVDPLTLALDGSNIGTGTTSASAALTTTNANDVIYVIVGTCSNAGTISVTATGLTFTSRGSTTATGGALVCTNVEIQSFYATTTSTLSALSITASVPTATDTIIHVFGISGADTSSPFDSNVSIPATATGTTSPSVTISTSQANDFIIGGEVDTGNVVGSAGTGFTLIQSGVTATSPIAGVSEDQIVSATQTNLAVTANADASADLSAIIADAITAKTSFGQSLTDSIPLTDTVSTAKKVSTSLSDSIPLTDTVSTSPKTISRSLSDSISLTDTVSANKIFFKSLSDSIPLTDTVSITKTFATSLSDSISLTDTISTAKILSKSLSDSIPLTDSVLATKTFTRSLSDSIALTDTVSTVRSFYRSLSDSISLQDQASRQIIISRTLSDSITLSATAAPNLGSYQQLVPAGVSVITVNPNQSDLVVADSCSTMLSTVIVPSTVTKSTLNYSSISQTSSGTTTVSICHGIKIIKEITTNNVQDVTVALPPNITISGAATSWKAAINLINSLSPAPVPVVPNTVNTITRSVEVGLGSTSLTFDKAARMVFIGSAGLHVGFYNTATPFTEITSACSDDTQTTNDGLASGGSCKINVGSDLIVWTKHFTGFATWSSSTSSGSTSTAASSGGTGGGAGAVGVGPSGATGLGPAGTSSQGFRGILTPNLKIYQVYYDVCTQDLVKITIGTDPGAHPTVILRTLSGIILAQLSKDQPYLQQNTNATIQKTVYEAHIDPKIQSFEVVILEAMGKNINTVGKTIDINGCNETISIENRTPIISQVDQSSPKIFDMKFQIGNSTKVSSSAMTNQYIDSKPMTVYSIIDSSTPINRAELRFVKLGDDISKYTAVSMIVSPLQISNTTYIVSGVIPKELAQSPAISYWVHIQNNAGKTSDSEIYSIGVKPSYSVSGKLEVDILLASAEGTTAKPIAYFTNTGSPVFGTVSLITDDKIVYTSSPQLFGAGQTAVVLKWKTPTLGYVMNHKVIVKYVGYDNSIETSQISVTTFPTTKTFSISQPVSIDVIQQNNNTVAIPVVIHSSFKDTEGDLRYHVAAPDGTCVIGSSENCLVTHSTIGHGNFKSVTIGNQIYRVKYFDSDSSLERFTITSVDSIVGDWKVDIVSDNGLVPSAHATQDVFSQVKYSSIETSFVTKP
jgi:hypothetical protein